MSFMIQNADEKKIEAREKNIFYLINTLYLPIHLEFAGH